MPWGKKNRNCINVLKLIICEIWALEYYKILPACPDALNPKRSSSKNIVYVREKGNVLTVHAMTAYKGNRGTAPLILNNGCRWR